MVNLSRRSALVGGAAALLGTESKLRSAQAQPHHTVIDPALRRSVENGRLCGVVGIVGTDQGTAYEGAMGRRGPLPSSAAMTPDSVFWIASMTKPLTTAAAMQLVEQGKLTLDEPLSRVLPELASVQVLEGFDGRDKPMLRPARRPITLRQLLTHTAGYTYDFFDANQTRYEKVTGQPPIITCKSAALQAPLAFDPGERWDYGIGVDLAGRAVEAVSGQPLGTYFQHHLFEPLGMASTAFTLTNALRARLVMMGARQADGSLTAVPFEMPQQPEFEMGGGGLYSTARDYMSFCRLFLNDGRADNGVQVLRPDTVAQMGQNQIGTINVAPLRTADPATTRDAEFFPGMVKKWGLGFMINTEDAPTGRNAGSLAWAGLANTYFWIDPKAKLAGVVLMQYFPFVDEAAIETFARFEAATYRAMRA